MNTPVSFEIAKLLNTKRFDVSCEGKYLDGTYFQSYFGKTPNEKYQDRLLQAPTIADVVMWLYEKHGIWIVVNPHKGENNLGEPFMEFDLEVWSFTDECVFHNTGLLYFNSPTEVYEAAIEYALNKLI